MFSLKYKKGQFASYMAAIALLVFFGFISIISYVIYDGYIDALNDTGLYTGQVQVTGEKFRGGISALDYVTVALMLIFIIGAGITSYKISATKLGFLITLVLAAVFGFISFLFNYVFQEMIRPAVLQVGVAVFPRTILVCTNLHWVMLALIIVGSVTLYGKREKGQYLS